MAADIISFPTDLKWLQGEAVCTSCGHKHQSVHPVGVKWLECPKCGLMMARMMNPVQRGEMHWHCKCDLERSDLFRINSDREIYCIICGEVQHF